MRTTEIFTVIAAIFVLVIMRSKAEPFWPRGLLQKEQGAPTRPSFALNSPISYSPRVSALLAPLNALGRRGSDVPGRPGMVYGKGGIASKSAYLKKIDVAEKLEWQNRIRDGRAIGRAIAPKRKAEKTVLDQHSSRAFDPSYFAVATPQGSKSQSRKSYNREWS